MPSVKKIVRNFWRGRAHRIKPTEKKSNLARVEKSKPKWAPVGNGGCGERWD